MEEEDDDLYGTNGAASQNASAAHQSAIYETNNVKDERMDEELEEGEEEEEEGSESDIDIITERKDLPPEPTPQPSRLNAVKTERKTSVDPTPKLQQPSTQPKTESPARTASISQRPGSSYPEVRTSSIDVNANPIWEPVGKPITEVDIDADLAEHDKPWRRPGADTSDYFNYGFDEFTWTTYTLKQKTMADTLAAQKAETAKFEMLFGGPGAGMPSAGAPGPQSSFPAPGGPGNPAAAAMGGGMPGAGGAMGAGMPPMPGMPGSDEMMQTMMQQMMAQGITDPTQLDFGAFMQGMQQMQGVGPGQGGMGAGGVPQGPAQGWGGGGGGGYGGGGGGGRGGRGGRRW